MNEKKIDRRIRYTKAVLKQSLLSLMREKSINRISVKELCEHADINRGTFYSHYRRPHDLLHQIELELKREIDEAIISHPLDGDGGTYDMVRAIIECLAANSEVCRVLLGANGDPVLLADLVDVARRRCIETWTRAAGTDDSVMMDYVYSFAMNGSVGIIYSWVKSGMNEKPCDIALLIDRLTTHGLSALKLKSGPTVC